MLNECSFIHPIVRKNSMTYLLLLLPYVHGGYVGETVYWLLQIIGKALSI